jgi:hypothetical protein
VSGSRVRTSPANPASERCFSDPIIRVSYMVEEPGRRPLREVPGRRASADTALGMNKQWLSRSVSLVAAASVVATGCGSRSEPQLHYTPIRVIYAVKLPGGQEGHASIKYQLPDGTMKLENVPLPGKATCCTSGTETKSW